MSELFANAAELIARGRIDLLEVPLVAVLVDFDGVPETARTFADIQSVAERDRVPVTERSWRDRTLHAAPVSMPAPQVPRTGLVVMTDHRHADRCVLVTLHHLSGTAEPAKGHIAVNWAARGILGL